jgi:hypothetical protein
MRSGAGRSTFQKFEITIADKIVSHDKSRDRQNEERSNADRDDVQRNS